MLTAVVSLLRLCVCVFVYTLILYASLRKEKDEAERLLQMLTAANDVISCWCTTVSTMHSVYVALSITDPSMCGMHSSLSAVAFPPSSQQLISRVSLYASNGSPLAKYRMRIASKGVGGRQVSNKGRYNVWTRCDEMLWRQKSLLTIFRNPLH